MKTRLWRTALILGLVSAIGPFAIDMYLPALPSIGESFGASLNLVQWSLIAFILAMGVTQLFYGPLSDILGRKVPLYIGTSVFGLASIGCALSPNIGVLIALRALQGFGAGAGTVIPRAVVRDLHTGTEAVRLMSLLMLVFSVSPILAPLSGSLVVRLAGWRGVFWVVAAAAAVGIALTALLLEETRPAHLRGQSSWSSAFSAYRRLLKDRGFLALALIGAFGMAAFFMYLANSSFVIIGHFGKSPTVYSLFFAANAAAFIGAAQFNGPLTRRYGLHRVMGRAIYGFTLTMLALFAVTALGVDSLAVMSVMLFIGYAFMGVILPNSSVLALERHGAIAGTASALLGTIQMTGATFAMAIAGLFANGRPLPMITGIATCAGIAFVLVKIAVRDGEPAAAAVEAAR